MNKRKTIIMALMAFFVLTLGVNFNAEAQIGISLGGLTEKGAKIPKAKKKGKPIGIIYGNTAIGEWNPATLQITFYQKDDKGQQIVYTIDQNSGAVKSHAGNAMGSMSNDGSLVSTKLGKLTVEEKSYPDFYVKKDGKTIGYVTPQTAYDPSKKDFGSFADEVSPLLVAYVYFGVLLSEEQASNFASGYGAKMTTDELEDMVQWNDKGTINMIAEYESSLPYAGFKASHPEFKNCKIGGVGLLYNKWQEYSASYGMKYWVVYELTDGRNIVTFNRVYKKWTYGDIDNRDNYDEFHEVTDWQRK